MEITEDIQYVGVNDHQIDLFESQYKVPHGMAYNSYVILDEKTAVMDTVDARFTEEWLGNVEAVLKDRKPDYLIVQHMEPDHSASIAAFMEKYPATAVVGNAKTFDMLCNFYGHCYTNTVPVKDKETLSLGRHTLHFFFAPMVHWPEVMMTYDETDQVLFSADAFGKFGANDVDEPWLDEARRYYIGIVGKYGMQVMMLFKKIAGLPLKTICSLHGPVLSGDLTPYLEAYQKWASYTPEEDGVVIAYTSVYGHTRTAVKDLEKALQDKGVKVTVYDLARCDIHEAVAAAFRYSKLVLATTTYNTDIFPPMRFYIENLTERNFQNRAVGFIQNGTWAPMAEKVMRGLLEKSKNITYLEHSVTIKSAVTSANDDEIRAMAEELAG
jgi:flavorubredoxin